MASLMMQEMGIKGIAAFGNYMIGREEAKISAILTRHQNTMAALSAAQSHNQITRNAAQIEEQFVLSSASDQVVAMQDEEAARLAAAASGTSGNSVTNSLHGLARSAAQKRYANSKARDTAHIEINDQRRQVEVAKAYGQARQVMPKPSAASTLLGLGTSLYDTWRQHNPQT